MIWYVIDGVQFHVPNISQNIVQGQDLLTVRSQADSKTNFTTYFHNVVNSDTISV
jgi:hypothetical protein